MTRKNRPSGLSFALLMLVMMMCVNWLWQTENQNQMEYAQVYQLFQQEKVESFTIDENYVLTMTLRSEVNGSTSARYQLHDFDLFYDQLDPLVKDQAAKGIITTLLSATGG